MLRKYFIAVISFTSVFNSYGQYNSPFIYDSHQSEYVGACDLITLHRSVYSFQDKYIPDTLFSERKLFRKTAGFGYRIGKLFLLDVQEDFFISLIQHEAFGHGARYREFGYKENSYYLSPFFPFGTSSGYARSGELKQGEIVTYHESVAKVFSGNEANLVLANTLSSQFLLNDTIHYRQALLYLISQNNQLEYIWVTRLKKVSDPTFAASGDIGTYISSVNYLYGPGSSSGYDIEKLCLQSMVSLINPVQLYTAYTILVEYGIKGKKELGGIPMIRIGNARYLPLLNYNLTPFGSEYLFTNFIRHKQRLFNFDLSLGDNTFNRSFGGTFKVLNVIDRQRLGINMSCSFWNQPELELEKYQMSETANKTGGSFKVDIMLRPFKLKNNLGMFIQTGYKSKGYTMGELLDETFILRYGISLRY